MLSEDAVVAAVIAYLQADGWNIESMALATQHGDDIVATRDGVRLLVEAKGQGSSMPHSRKYGLPFSRNQVKTHIAVAVLRSLGVVSVGAATAALALPDDALHRREIERVAPALSKLGIGVFWVDQAGTVSLLE